MSVNLKNILLISFVLAPFFIMGQNTLKEDNSPKSDPLLSDPWVDEIKTKEENFFHRFSTAMSESPGFEYRFDKYNRKYKIKKNGEIEFDAYRDYKFHLPDCDQIEIHLAEAKSLEKRGLKNQAFLLLNGLELCFRLKEQTVFISEEYKEANKILNRLVKKYGHERALIDLYADPYSCYFTKNKKRALAIESSIYPFKLIIPDTFQYLYPRNLEEITGKTKLNQEVQGLRGYTWKINRYYHSFPLVKNNGKNPQDNQWMNAYSKQSSSGKEGEGFNNIDFIRFDKIILTIGTTFHYSQDIYKKETYYLLWDLLRGLTEKRKDSLSFKRRKGNGGYVSSYNFIDDDGEVRMIYMNELYYLRENRGIFILLSYPEKYLENGRNLWHDIVKNTIIK